MANDKIRHDRKVRTAKFEINDLVWKYGYTMIGKYHHFTSSVNKF
jgi:hypothetical protein